MKYILKILKKPIIKAFNILGYQISPYQQPNKAFNVRYPQCRHLSGFLYDIFGHLMYQNIEDPINYAGYMGKDIESYGKSNHDEVAMIINRIKAAQHVLDIGANIGLYTLLLAKLVGDDGSVIAFEPGPISYNLLSLNTIINGYKNITLVNKGVTAATRTEYYYSNKDAESGSTVTTLSPDFGHPRGRIPIETIALDDYFQASIPSIDYIKIDIEGGEFNALKGMTKVLTANRHIWLTIEYAPYLPLWKDVDLQEFLSFIRSLGFKIYDLHQSGFNPVRDIYLLDNYPKEQVGKYSNLLLQRS
jgi:FkbM family methyltransferase